MDPNSNPFISNDSMPHRTKDANWVNTLRLRDLQVFGNGLLVYRNLVGTCFLHVFVSLRFNVYIYN